MMISICEKLRVIISKNSKIMNITRVGHCCDYCDYCNYCDRLLDLFRAVFLDSNKLDLLLMYTESVHSFKYCHVDVTNYANPINCCWDGPEGGQVVGQVARLKSKSGPHSCQNANDSFPE